MFCLQDGTREEGIAATKLYAIQDDTYSSKYKPNVFVFPENPISSVYGVIESAHNVERTSKVRVQWFNMEGRSRNVYEFPVMFNQWLNLNNFFFFLEQKFLKSCMRAYKNYVIIQCTT